MLHLLALCFAGLVVATLIHELGHLTAGYALRCDPRLLSIGVGPALLRRRIGALWVVLRALPFGGYVQLPPRSATRRLASLGLTAAGPAANFAALLLLLALQDHLPDDVWFMASYGQGIALASTLLPYSVRTGGRGVPSDGLRLLQLLARPRRYSTEAIYDAVAAAMRSGSAAPAMTPAFAEIVLQQSRIDRREAWARRQAIDGLEEVLAGTTANAMERDYARAVLHGTVDAEQALFRAGRAAPAPAGALGAAAAEASVARATNWLWLAVPVVAIVGTIYDYRRTGVAGHARGPHLRFEPGETSADGRRLVALRGAIGGDAIVELHEAIERYGLQSGDTLLLDSPGGEVGSAAVMGRLIRKHGLATAVGTLRDGEVRPSSCASACVTLFAAGTQRTLDRGSRLGIHRFRSTGTAGMSEAAIERSARATANREVAYFAEMGVAPELEEEASKVPSDDIRWLTPEEALDLRLATKLGG